MSTPITCAGEYEWTSTVRSDWIIHNEWPTAKNREFASFICGFKRWLCCRVKSPGKLTERSRELLPEPAQKYCVTHFPRQFARTTMIKSRVYANKSYGFIFYFLFRRAETLTYAVHHHFPRHAPHPGNLEPTLAPSFPDRVSHPSSQD